MLRRKSEEAEIVFYEKDKYISYGTCGLPYFISGKIDNINKIIINTTRLFKKRFNLKVNASHEVIGIGPYKSEIRIKNLETGELFKDSYSNLIITTGSKFYF